jgi:predicted transcriptional regulator
MPTARPRLYITLTDDLAAALAELADAMDKPVSVVTVDLLKEMTPQIEGLAKLVRHAKEGNRVAAKRTLQHMIGDSMAEIIGQQLELTPKKRK